MIEDKTVKLSVEERTKGLYDEYSKTSSVIENQWTHIAASVNQSIVSLFIIGVIDASFTGLFTD